MVCQSCHQVAAAGLCERCQRQFARAVPRVLPGGLLVRGAFEHSGPARRLVHDLKYRGIETYARLVAAVVAPQIPRLPLVPVPRAWTRQARYGVDPATSIANELAKRLGVPVVHLLRRPVHQPRRAGRAHGGGLEYRCLVPFSYSDLIVVDDVVTTGTTVLAAAAAIGQQAVRLAVAANVVTDRVSVTDATYKV